MSQHPLISTSRSEESVKNMRRYRCRPALTRAAEWPAHAKVRPRSGADPGLCPMPERARARPFLAGLLSPTHESSPTCYLIKTYCPFLRLKGNKFVHLFHRHRRGRAVAARLFFCHRDNCPDSSALTADTILSAAKPCGRLAMRFYSPEDAEQSPRRESGVVCEQPTRLG